MKMKVKVIKIDIDEDALRILKETEQRIRETDPDRKVNYSAAIRQLAKPLLEWKGKVDSFVPLK